MNKNCSPKEMKAKGKGKGEKTLIIKPLKTKRKK